MHGEMLPWRFGIFRDGVANSKWPKFLSALSSVDNRFRKGRSVITFIVGQPFDIDFVESGHALAQTDGVPIAGYAVAILVARNVDTLRPMKPWQLLLGWEAFLEPSRQRSGPGHQDRRLIPFPLLEKLLHTILRSPARIGFDASQQSKDRPSLTRLGQTLTTNK